MLSNKFSTKWSPMLATILLSVLLPYSAGSYADYNDAVRSFFNNPKMIRGEVELLAIPMVEEVGEPVTQGNISFTARVYGLPLKKIRACINIDGVRRKGKCVPRFGPADIVNTDMGTFNSSRVYFTWSYGHMDRGNLFGKATWTVSGHSSHKLFPLAKFILRVRNGKRVKKFVFNSEGRDQARFCRCIKDYSSDLVVPKEEELASGEPVTQKSTSFTTLVYGTPLGIMSACINAYRVKRLCTKFEPHVDTNEFSGNFSDSLAKFTWSHGHTNRGNLFRNATWTLSGDSSHELFPRTDFVLRFSSNDGDKPMKKFLFSPKGDNQAHLCPCQPAVAFNRVVAQTGWPEPYSAERKSGAV